MSMFENHKTIAYKEYREFVNESVLELIKRTKDKKCNGCIDFVFDEETSTGHCVIQQIIRFKFHHYQSK